MLILREEHNRRLLASSQRLRKGERMENRDKVRDVQRIAYGQTVTYKGQRLEVGAWGYAENKEKFYWLVDEQGNVIRASAEDVKP